MLKRIVKPALLLAVLTTCLAANAQDLIPDKNEKGKWGYVDQSGSWVIKPKFEYAGQFENGRAKVGKDGKFGYIDYSGKEVIKIDFTEIGLWEDGKCKVAKGGDRDDDGNLKDQKYGYINIRGEELLKCEYDEIGSFNKFGLAYVHKDDKYGYIRSSDYSFAIPCEFSAVGTFNDSGFCWVAKGGSFSKDDPSEIIGCSIGIYNSSGNVVVPVKFGSLGYWEEKTKKREILTRDFPEEITDNIANRYFQTPDYQKMNNLYTTAAENYSAEMQNQKAKILTTWDDLFRQRDKLALSLKYQNMLMKLPLSSYYQELRETDALVFVVFKFSKFSKLSDHIKGDYLLCGKGGGSGLFNISGAVARSNSAIHAAFGSIYQPTIYTLQGTEVIPAKFQHVGYPGKRFTAVSKKDGEWNIYDSYKQELVGKNGVKGNLLEGYINGVMVMSYTPKVKKGETAKSEIFIVDSQTLQTCSNTYDGISEGIDGYYIVMRDSLYGIIDFSGKEILAPNYRVIQRPTEGLFCVKKGPDDLFGFVDGTGNYVIEPQYNYAFQFHNGMAIVKKDGKWGIIDKQNNTLVDFKWACIYPQENAGQPVWVYDSTSWHALDVTTGQFLFNEGIDLPMSNFGEEGFAVVANEENKLSVIDKSGNLFMPYTIQYRQNAIDCYHDFKALQRESIRGIEAYRYEVGKLNATRRILLSEPIPSEMWNY